MFGFFSLLFTLKINILFFRVNNRIIFIYYSRKKNNIIFERELQYVAESKVHSVKISLSTYVNLKTPKTLLIFQKLYSCIVHNCPNGYHIAQPKSKRHRFEPSATRNWRTSHYAQFNSIISHKLQVHHIPNRYTT